MKLFYMSKFKVIIVVIVHISALVIVSEFATISFSSLDLVTRHAKGRLLAEWLDQLNAAKPELIAAALHSVARVLNHEESYFVENNNTTFHVFSGATHTAGREQCNYNAYLKHN